MKQKPFIDDLLLINSFLAVVHLISRRGNERGLIYCPEAVAIKLLDARWSLRAKKAATKRC